MSGIVVPIEAQINLLQYMLNAAAPDDAILRLYENEVTLSKDTVLGDFTEATDPGYAAITLLNANWAFAEIGETGVVQATYAEQTFTFTGAQDIYGYYLTNTGNTKLLWAHSAECVGRFTSGGSFMVTPTFATQSVH